MLSAEEKYWRAMATRRPRVARSDMARGAVTCLGCLAWPVVTFVRRGRYWMAYCPDCDAAAQTTTASTHAALVATWNAKHRRWS